MTGVLDDYLVDPEISLCRLRSSRRCGLGIPGYSDRAACRPSHTVETVIGTEAEPRECHPARRLTAASIGPGPTA
jgi:hypothetical protein